MAHCWTLFFLFPEVPFPGACQWQSQSHWIGSALRLFVCRKGRERKIVRIPYNLILIISIISPFYVGKCRDMRGRDLERENKRPIRAGLWGNGVYIEEENPKWRHPFHSHSLSVDFNGKFTFLTFPKVLVAAKEAKDSEREAPNAIAKFCVTTSRASRSRPSVVLPVVAVSSASLGSSTRKLAVFSRCSSRTWSVTPSPTRNTPRGRRSPPWTSFTPWNDRAVPSTVSVVKLSSFDSS